MSKHTFNFQIVPQIIFGPGSAEKIGREAKERGGKKALLITDAGIVKAGILKTIENSLSEAGLEWATFAEVEPEPWRETADLAAASAKENNCNLIIGIGGGSAMDIAKAAAVLATNPGKAQDYQGLNKVPQAGLAKIMLPTTAGTGSELTFTAVLSNKEPKGKAGINSPYLYPELAILDPELTLSAPPGITASTGMDALTHAIEAYTSLIASPLSDAVALRAIELITPNLPLAVAEGKNIAPREKMLLGSLLAGMGLANAGVTAAHALAYPLGGFFRVPHGIANGLMLPFIIEYNLEAAPEKFARVAQAMGEKIAGLSLKEQAKKAQEAVSKLMKQLPVPRRIGELEAKISAADFPGMAQAAMQVARPLENNPRPLKAEDIVAIYKKAY